jgi:hypothetical protein
VDPFAEPSALVSFWMRSASVAVQPTPAPLLVAQCRSAAVVPEDEPLEEPLLLLLPLLLEEPLLLLEEPLLLLLPPEELELLLDDPGRQLIVPEIVVKTSPEQAPLSGSETVAVTVTPPTVVQVNVGVAEVVLLNVPAPVCPPRSTWLHWMAALPTVAMARALELPTGSAEGLIEKDVIPGQFVGGSVTTTTPASTASDPVVTSAGATASFATVQVKSMLTLLTAPAPMSKGAVPVHGSALVSVALRAIVYPVPAGSPPTVKSMGPLPSATSPLVEKGPVTL